MESLRPIAVAELADRLPAEPSATVEPEPLASDERLVVLDDDPTGNQTVHDVPVLAEWTVPVLHEALRDAPTVFVLTNSRALSEAASRAVYEEIAGNLVIVAEELGVTLRLASRSDSTLRGHFPSEVTALSGPFGIDTCLLVPCFVEGGRWTFEDVHWVREGDELQPVGQTPYSRDPSFSFASSHLPSWVEEKTGGSVRAEEVVSIGLEDLRAGDAAQVAARLHAGIGGVIIVNAVTDADLARLVAGLRVAEADGFAAVYRCGASFVRARAAIARREPLTGREVRRSDGRGGGLVVCGSHVPNSTRQLDHLLRQPGVTPIEVDVPVLLEGAERRADQIASVVDRAKGAMQDGSTAVVFTSRQVVDHPDLEPLEVAARVSAALVEIVEILGSAPAFLVSKGGITSHDLATKALRMSRGTVLGQLIPGVSVWRLEDGAAPGTPFVVFPGNVGDETSLTSVVERLTADERSNRTPGPESTRWQT